MGGTHMRAWRLDQYRQHHEKAGIGHGEESHRHREEARGDKVAGLRFGRTDKESRSVKPSIAGSAEPTDYDSASTCP
jgi:hypothetical protein